jgi:ADP-ribose pyrophosphatase YjhB (NUDIX family)
MEISRHFTASCYIFFNNKILFHKHKKLKIYLPIGGHIEINETPKEAVLREVKEECGLEVEILGDDKKLDDGSSELSRGEFLNCHKINEFHEHMDFVFFGIAKSDNLNPKKGESKEFVWIEEEELDKLDLRENVKKYSKLLFGRLREEN